MVTGPIFCVGGFPSTGPGSSDLYEIYGNFFLHNPRESLLHASGRVTIHDNVFADCPSAEYAAITLRDHDLPLELAPHPPQHHHLPQRAESGSAKRHRVPMPSSAMWCSLTNPCLLDLIVESGGGKHHGSYGGSRLNTLIEPDTAGKGVNFQPRSGRCEGEALDLTPFAAQTAH